MNLKHDRGSIPEEVREAFRELCRQPRVDSVLALIDNVVQPLEDARPELAASRRREVAPARAGDADDADGSEETLERGSKDDPAEEVGVAAACDQAAEAAIRCIRGIVDARPLRGRCRRVERCRGRAHPAPGAPL